MSKVSYKKKVRVNRPGRPHKELPYHEQKKHLKNCKYVDRSFVHNIYKNAHCMS